MKQIILLTIVCSINFTTFGQSQQELDSLKIELETIFMKDQTFRRMYVEAENKLGKDSNAYEYFWEVVEAQDKVLEKEVIDLIDKYGWLGISQVGRLANATQWSVLQHGSVASKANMHHC